MTTYVLLASKPGQFRTELGEGLERVETYDYVFAGRTRASYMIASMTGAPRIRVVDETDPPVVNLVPSKFLEKFATIEAARAALNELAGARGLDITLAKR
jgi:hypothetical protein